MLSQSIFSSSVHHRFESWCASLLASCLFLMMFTCAPDALAQGRESTSSTPAQSLQSQFDQWQEDYSIYQFREKQLSTKEYKEEQQKKRQELEVNAESALRKLLEAQPTKSVEDRKLFKAMSLSYFNRFSEKEFAFPGVSSLYERFIRVMPQEEFNGEDLEEASTNIRVSFTLLLTEDALELYEIEQFKDQLPLLLIEVDHHPELVDRSEFAFSIMRVGQDSLEGNRMIKTQDEIIKAKPKLFRHSKSESTYILPVDRFAEYRLDLKAEKYFYEDDFTTDFEPITAFIWSFEQTLYLIYYPHYKQYPLEKSHTLHLYQWKEEDEDTEPGAEADQEEARRVNNLHSVTVKPGVINEIKLPDSHLQQEKVLLLKTRYGNQLMYQEEEGTGNSTDHFTTDRTVYRPGDRIHFKWIRRQIEKGQISLPDLKKVTAQLISPNGQVLQSKELELSVHGSVTGYFDLSPDATPQIHQVRLLTGEPINTDHLHPLFDDMDDAFGGVEFGIRVEAYKKSPLKVSIQEIDSDEEHMRFRVKAFYRGGGEANGFMLYWRMKTRESFILNVPRWDLPFLPSAPWAGPRAWFTGYGLVDRNWGYSSHEGVMEGSETISKGNEMIIKLSREKLQEEADQKLKDLQFQVLIQDTLGNLATVNHTLEVQSSVKLTARADAHHYSLKDHLTAHLMIHDHNEMPIPNTKIKLRFSRLIDIEQQEVSGNTSPRRLQVMQDWKHLTEIELHTNQQGKIKHRQSLEHFGVGVIRMTMIHEDNKGRKTRNHRYFFTSPAQEGSYAGDPYLYKLHLSQLENDPEIEPYDLPNYDRFHVIPDRPLYQAGDKVKLLYIGMTVPEQTFLQVKGSQTSLIIPFKPSPNQSLSFTIPEEESSSILYLQVFSISASGQLIQFSSMIEVDKASDDIQITLKPDQLTYEPGDTLTLDLQTTQRGKALSSEVEIAIVDEAIYKIHEEDNLDIRRYVRPGLVRDEGYGLGNILFDDSLDFTFYDDDRQPYAMGIFGSADEGVYPSTSPQQSRSRFKDTAFYQGQVMTDAQGRARLTIRLPDDLTKWRITARAISGERAAGQQTMNIVTKKNISLRLGGSRFYRDGDQAQLVVHLSSLAAKDHKLGIRIELEGAALIDEEKSLKEILLSAGKSKSLQWPIRITDQKKVKFKAWAMTPDGKVVDAIEVTRPVLSRAIDWIETETKNLSKGQQYQTTLFQPTNTLIPVDTIQLSLTGADEQLILQSLPALIRYPYGCVEQTMSRYLPALVVQHQHPDLLKQVPARYESLIKEALPKALSKGEQRLFYFQKSRGGWGWWRYDQVNPFMTAYVLWGFQLSEKAGREIPDQIQKKGYEALERSKNLDAFGWYVLQQAGRGETYFMIHTLKEGKPRKLLFDLEKKVVSEGAFVQATDNDANRDITTLKLTGHNRHLQLAWLVLSGYHDLLSYIPSLETIKNDKNRPRDGDWVKTISVLLMAHLSVNPKSPSVAACLNELLVLHQSEGWVSTLDSAYAILALSEYFKKFPSNNKQRAYTVFINDQPMELPAGTHQIPFPIKQGNPFKIRYQHTYDRPINISWKLEYKNLKPKVNAAKALTELQATWEFYDTGKSEWLELPPTNKLKRGQLLRLSFKYEKSLPHAKQLMLIIPIHAGIEPILPPTSYHVDDDFVLEGMTSWSSIRPIIRDDEIRAPMQAIHDLADLSLIFNVSSAGHFHAPPAHLFMMYHPDKRAITKGRTIQVQP